MALTRLENFIKNVEGNILYVNPNDLDASDSILNQGNSLTRPFKSIQRALIEASRFSYLTGSNNDKFDKTTIIVYPGEYTIDNRPGYTAYNNSGSAVYKDINGNTISSYLTTGLTQSSNFDLSDPNNILYTFNSSSGGVIIPRGTSIVGMDLRKTKVRPLFVPDPTNSSISSSAIFKITGACYFSQFTLFDANPQGFCYKDYTTTKSTPLFSHHKLTSFEYADGINKIGTTDLTDLQMYYYKVAQAFGSDSGRSIGDFPSTTDFEPKIDEYRIVAEVSSTDLGISSIRSGNGVTGTSTITVTTNSTHNLQVDSPIRITGISQDASIYNGSFVVSGITSTNQFQYTASSIPTTLIPTTGSSKVMIEADSVSSSSPYILNCTLRSVYGMSGMHADGNKATGFKSMLVAQFTGVSLQKDDNAFLKYDSGSYKTQTQLGSSVSLHTDSDSVYNPDYANFHIKSSNGAIIQAVSVFAIGFAEQYVTQTGGDQSVTNSNSNFGSLALKAGGFRVESFDKDDAGYITHIVPPKENLSDETNVPWLSLDSSSIINAGVGYTDKLYLDGFTDSDTLPPHNVDSYKIGARQNDIVYININNSGTVTTYSAPIIMQGSTSTSFEKSFNVYRNGSTNQINSNETIVLTGTHNFTSGEKVILFAEDGNIPDGLSANTLYYVVSVGSTSVKLSDSYNNATASSPITINNIQTNGGKLRIVSRVSDKKPGEFGHPIQFDSTNNKWYLQSTSTNGIRSGMISIGVTAINLQSPTTYIKRKQDSRSLSDRIYRVRYVIPKEVTSARIPSDGFILQESKTVLEDTTSSLTNSSQLRNTKIIATASWSANTATVRTEKPHALLVGDNVKISKVTSGINTAGTDNVGYNGIFTVVSVPTTKTFTYALTTNPGTFTNIISTRDSNLPVVSRNKFNDIFSVYRTETIQAYSSLKRDGIYHLTLLKGSISPTASQFSSFKFNQPVRDLYPSQDRDNYNTDPEASKTVALNSSIGITLLNDTRNSPTKETVNDILKNTNIAIGVTSVVSTGTSATLYSTSAHRLNPAVSLTLVSGGTGYATTNRNVLLTNRTGEGLSINVTSVSSGAINGWEIVDGGSNYSVGTAVTAYGNGGGNASFTIASIRNDVGKIVQVTGIATTGYGGESNPYNGVFRITSIDGLKQFSYGISTTGGTYSSGGQFYISDNGIKITSIVYDSTSGIATVSTGSTAHGLFTYNRFNIVGTPQTQYNGSFIVDTKVGLTTVSAFIGKGLTLPSYSGNSYIAKNIISSYGQVTGSTDENIGNRLFPIYANQTTYTTATIAASATSVGVSTNVELKKGDYVQIDEEIVRIADDPTGSSISIIRGSLGTISASHSSGSEVKKIKVLPLELRRPSFIRSSNHTFEYMGFGPGNYSTALPQRQSKVLTKNDQLLAQKRSESGGVVVYTGMNSDGDFYIGNKRLSSNTAQEETLDAPIFEYYGEPITEQKLSAIFDDINVRDRIKVDGGSGNIVRSEFNGPVLFSNKTTSTSTIEAKSFLVKGNSDNASTITVGTQTPTSTGQGGDLVLQDSPSGGSFLGWVWTDSWKRFAPISTTRDSVDLFIDRLGIGVTQTPLKLQVNGDAQFGNVTLSNLYTAGVSTFVEPVNFQNVFVSTNLTVTNNLSVTSGITTLKQTGITTAYIGISSVGFSTITSGYIGVATVGFSTITSSFLNSTQIGVATVGFVTATNAIIGVATVGLQAVTTDLNVGRNFQVAGVSTFVGNVTFQGGTINLGDANTDNVVFTADVNSNVVPNTNNTFDLGSSSQSWRNLYVGFTSSTNISAGVITATTLNVTSLNVGVATVGFSTITSSFLNSTQIGVATVGFVTATNAIIGVATVGLQAVTTDLSVGGNFQVAGVSTFVGNVTFRGGTINLGDANTDNVVFTADVNSNVVPNTNNTFDLGSSSQSWRNLYVGFVTSTNAFVGIQTVNSISIGSSITLSSGVPFYINESSGNSGEVLTSQGNNNPIWKNASDLNVGSANSISITNTTTNNTYYPLFSRETNTNAFVRNSTSTLVFNPSTVRLGIGSTAPQSTLDVQGNVRISGFSTITSSFLNNTQIGVATVGFASITNTQIGVSTVGFASITSSFLNNTQIGVATVGLQTVTTDLNVGRNFQVAGVSTFVGNVTFRGGTIGLGDANTDNVEFNADINSNVIPNTGNSFDLGSSSQKWRNLYVGFTSSTNISAGVITATTLNVTSLNVGDAYETAVVGFTTSINGDPPVGIHSVSAATYRTVKYVIQAQKGTDHQFTEMTALHNGSQTFVSQFNELVTNQVLGIYSVDLSGSNILLTIDNQNAGITTYKVIVTSYKV